MIRKLTLLGACSALAFAITGCGSDDDSSPAPAAALTGTAATGAAIANATVVVRCATGSSITTSTDAAGVYTVTVDDMDTADAAVPCGLQITLPDLSTLYSLASANGTANITPLTNLAVAAAVNTAAGVSPDAWFGNTSLTLPTAQQIADAQDAVEAALLSATGESTVPFDIFTTAFDAGTTDAYDVWLDELNAALADTGTSYASLVTAFIGSGGFGTIVIDITPPDDGGSTGGGTGGGGTSTLTVTVSAAGVTGPATVVNNVTAPSSQAEFCGATEYQSYFATTGGTLTINSCSFSGSTGTINATVNITSPYSMSIPYIANYEWN